MPNGPTAASPRRPWMATAIWGWRLELYLTVGSFLVLASTGEVTPIPYVAGYGGVAWLAES